MNIKKLALLIPALVLLGSCSCSEASLVMADCEEGERCSSAKIKRAPVMSSSSYPASWDFDAQDLSLAKALRDSIPLGITTLGIDVDRLKGMPEEYSFDMNPNNDEYSFTIDLEGNFDVWEFALAGSGTDLNRDCENITIHVYWQFDRVNWKWNSSVSVVVWDSNSDSHDVRNDFLFECLTTPVVHVYSDIRYGNWGKLETDWLYLIRDMTVGAPEGSFEGRYNFASLFSQVSTASCLIPAETPYFGTYIPGYWFWSNEVAPFISIRAEMVDLKAGSKISKEGQAVTSAVDDQYKFIRAIYGVWAEDNSEVKIAEYNPNFYYPLGNGAWNIQTDLADDLWIINQNLMPFLGVGCVVNANLNPTTGQYMDAYPNHDQAVVSPWDYVFNREGGNVYKPWEPNVDWNKGEPVTTSNAVSSTFNLLGFAFGALLPILSIQVIPGLSLWLFILLPLVATIVVLIFKAVKK